MANRGRPLAVVAYGAVQILVPGAEGRKFGHFGEDVQPKKGGKRRGRKFFPNPVS